MARTLVIIGAGGHGRVCADVAAAAGLEVAGFIDAAIDVGEAVNGVRVVGVQISDIVQTFGLGTADVFVAIGNNARRIELLDEALGQGYLAPPLIHPSAVISPSAEIGAGSVIVAGAVVNANARIGRGSIVNTSCSLDHDNDLSAGVQIGPGVHAAGCVSFGEMAFVGTGAVIIPNINIGARAVVAAGAVVTSDVGDEEMVTGVPATPVQRET